MRYKKIFMILFITLLISVIIIFGIKVYWNSKMIVKTFPSPTSEYTIEMRFTCAFSISYHGDFYLLVNKNKYFLNSYAPDECKWISDKEFTIGDVGSITGMYRYNVDNVIEMGAKKSAETIFYPVWEEQKTN